MACDPIQGNCAPQLARQEEEEQKRIFCDNPTLACPKVSASGGDTMQCIDKDGELFHCSRDCYMGKLREWEEKCLE